MGAWAWAWVWGCVWEAGHRLRTLPLGRGVFGALATPPTHIRKIFLRQKMKFIKGAGNLRPISGTQNFFLASDPPPPPAGGGGLHVALVSCSRLQPAAPIGRSPFTALPLDPFPP